MTDQLDHDDCGCSEYRELSRRQFVTTAAGISGAAAAAAVFPEWLPKIVLAQTFAGERDVIVSIFQRGGADGLNLCVPFGDPAYYTGRSTIAIPPPDATLPADQKVAALDNMFGFAPAMQSLLPAFASGNLLVMHAAGQSYVSRSHFDAQRYMEVGKPADVNYVTGWLGRHLALVPPMKSDAVLRALGVANGLQKSLVGGPRTLPIANPANFTIGGAQNTAAARQAVITTDYAGAPAPLDASALDAVNTIALLQSVNFAGYTPMNGAVYPNTSFGRALQSVATLIQADVGIEAAQVDIGGWDTHAAQGGTVGALSTLTDQFASALAAFHADIVATNTRVTVVVISEFGRNARENGSQGTDHGRASTMYAMGQGIAGGRVLAYGTNGMPGWPGLAIENLEKSQDLKVTLDYRDVLAEIVQNRLGNTQLDQVFPAWTPTFRGVTL
ncbi:MAG: DUF1501 domain-containing protein [Gemmatimonadetes bacterium]|nr:DUF1501 domain-containing protein [Gemmatimonadota bacterium]